MMHQVWFLESNSYKLICNYLESKINRWKLSKGTVRKYLPGLIKAMHNCGIEFDNDDFKKYVEKCEPKLEVSKIINNYQEIVNKAISCKTHKQSRLFLADCLIYNLMFITKCPEEMLLSIKLNDIEEYMDTSSSIMHKRYKIKLGEYGNTIISKKAYIAIYAICKIINGWNKSIAILSNYTSSNFHTRFSRHHNNYLSILMKNRQKHNGEWIESNKLNEFLNNFIK